MYATGPSKPFGRLLSSLQVAVEMFELQDVENRAYRVPQCVEWGIIRWLCGWDLESLAAALPHC